MAADEKFMREAIRLAKKGLGKTRPNPAVGCVIVKSGRVIGRGYHKKAGLPHAEIEALRSMRNPAQARGATAYITLEPCSTHGRTPPCTRALIEAGLARVVIGAIDPNPRHRGRALTIFRRTGLKVVSGVLANECADLNAEFHHTMTTGLPWVIAKCGMSLDGRLTRPPGESQWITSAAARRDAMQLRARVDAILVGAATVREDDPTLTLRGISGEQPWRIVWTPRSSIPHRSKLLTDRYRHKTLLCRQKSLRSLFRELAKRDIRSVLVEGGGHTLGELFSEGLVNELVFYVAPLLSGGAVPALAGRVPLADPARLESHGITCSPLAQNIRIGGRIAKHRE